MIYSDFPRNCGDRCVIPEIALYYDGSGQHLLRASALSALSASLCEIILALGFHLHERGVVRDRWGGAPHPQAWRVQSPGLVREAPRGWGGVYSFTQRRQTPPPSPPLKGRGDLRNYCNICVIPEIALYYDGAGQDLLLVFASLCEIILALGFHLHERGVVRDRWGGAPHPASTNERARKSAQPSPAWGEGPTRIAWGRGILVRFRRCRPTPNPSRLREGKLSLLSPTLARDNARCSLPRPWRLAPACLRRQSRRP